MWQTQLHKLKSQFILESNTADPTWSPEASRRYDFFQPTVSKCDQNGWQQKANKTSAVRSPLPGWPIPAWPQLCQFDKKVLPDKLSSSSAHAQNYASKTSAAPILQTYIWPPRLCLGSREAIQTHYALPTLGADLAPTEVGQFGGTDYTSYIIAKLFFILRIGTELLPENLGHAHKTHECTAASSMPDGHYKPVQSNSTLTTPFCSISCM